MSVDLTFLPFDCDQGDFAYSHTVLQCRQSYELFDFLKTLPLLDVPAGFTSFVSRDDAYEDSHYGVTVEDPYGDPVKYTTVAMILTTPKKLLAEADPTTRAIWAYFREINRYTKVALFWH